MTKAVIKAFAKINLTLDVLHKRPDGYHEVAMLMQGITLHDLLEVEILPREGVYLSTNDRNLDSGPSNLAYRAALLMQKYHPQKGGLRITLQKNIPLAAGLGGGSSDAAAVLVAVNKLWGLQLAPVKLADYAAELGSDVPFCLEPLTALATGRGEVISSQPEAPRFWAVLLKPPYGASTKEVYGHLHQVNIQNRPNQEEALRALQKQNLGSLLASLGNVLEYAAFSLYPQLAPNLEEIRDLGAEQAIMSGSGTTLVGFFREEKGARELAGRWQKPGWQVYVVRSLGRQDIEERMVVYAR